MVLRCAVKGPPDPVESLARSPSKPQVPGFMLSASGAKGDYNQFRTETLKGEPKRAISILTTDVLQALNSEGWPVQQGDMGENVVIGQVPYSFFAVGTRYMIGSALVEISEAIQPCANLCRLSYMTSQQVCQRFIQTLKGRRGWYGRVITPGMVNTGDSVERV
mmetsp:Transcript_9904/g.15485  ORF Transcript_9904/g.15485 Transcript_9904/m.15485 type:complete len:163 (-) Transcript_9904:334-822(-)